MAPEQYKTQVLLLHSEQSTLHNLSTGFNDRYSVHLATSGMEALNIFSETPVHVIVSAQDLPGMSGLDALREAKKRSPDTIGILLAGSDKDDGLEALVDARDIFQIIRGPIKPEALRTLIDSVTKRARQVALFESANDTTANLDLPPVENIALETAENGSAMTSDGTGRMQALQLKKVSVAPDARSRNIDVLVLTRDEVFLETIRDSSHRLHKLHHAVTPKQAIEVVKNHKVGVLVTDAAMVGPNIEVLTQRLRQNVPRLVAIVAGRRDDGELLMDLINRGHVYRFLLKPVSPGRARLAIEASINHHLNAPEKAFSAAPQTARKPQPKPAAKAPPAVKPGPASKAPAAMKVSRADSLIIDGPGDAFTVGGGLTETSTGIAASVNKKISGVARSVSPESKSAQAATTRSRNPETAFISALLGNPKILGIAAGIIIAAASIIWFAPQPADAPPAEFADDSSVIPSVIESDIVQKQAPAAIEATISDNLLAAARAARDAGQLVVPPDENAVDLYMSVLLASPGDLVATLELAVVVEQVFGLAESAILEHKLEDASIALQMLQLASPENPRLPFLSAQLAQLQLRRTVDNARIAIREGRFEDAGGWIGNARGLAGSDSVEVNVVSHELSAARNAQQVDEMLTLARSRLELNQLIQPPNDNAVYFYELALSNEPDNTAARQGLGIIASKLILQASIAVDDGQLANAETLLRNARALDPSSKQLAESAAALENAKKALTQAADDATVAAAIAEAERLAEQRRLAEQKTNAAAGVTLATVVDAAATDSNADAGKLQAPTVGIGNDKAITLPRADKETGNTASDAVENQKADDSQIEAGLAAAPVALIAPSTDTDYAEPAAQIRASIDNSTRGQPSLPATGRAAKPEKVAISSLTRINYVAPRYPRSAQRRNVTGTVDVGFTVQKNGSVTDIVVLDSTPGKLFDQAATDAVAQWRFEPTIENGQRMVRQTAVRLSFELQ